MIRLSIIIPFYNVEKYISQCLDSVFDQDIPLDEYEVICVNDGSPDNSREIVLDYMKRYPNLKLIEHDHNKKLGTARNTGRLIAQGAYIWNVDSDDMIVSNCLSRLLLYCEMENLDILLFNYLVVYPSGEVKKALYTDVNLQLMDGITFIEKIASQCIANYCPIWKQLYSRSFLDRNNIWSPEINMGEDVPFAFETMLKAQKMHMVADIGYVYRLNEESLTGRIRKLEPQVLYEKCILNSRMIHDVACLVPQGHPVIYESYVDVARYTIGVYEQYLSFYQSQELHSFWGLCRKNILRDKHIFKLMSYESIFRYLINMIFN